MLLCMKRDQHTLFRITRRLLTTDASKTTNNAPKVHIVGRKKPRLALSERLKEIKERGSLEWITIEKKQYKAIPSPNNVPVATLAHGLDRVLFSRGVHYLKDLKSEEYNFTPYLENIIQPSNINFNALAPYITSSKDTNLIEMARNYNSRYIGSTSSLSATLSQFYFTMSNFKEVDVAGLSEEFKDMPTKFTRGTKVAASICLRWKEGVYAIDADKALDGEDTILSEMGKSLEKVLTLEPEQFAKYLKDSTDTIDEEERNQPESYAYGQFEKFLLRSQLDCYHPDLRRKTFDLKTRAAIPVRLDMSNYQKYLGYSLKSSRGLYESYEREYYDMIRSAFLKYTFQVRIGHMDGILVAYHNTKKIFGFQYISRTEMDKRLFGSSRIGDQVFHNSLSMLQNILDTATEKYPEQSLRLSFESSPGEKNASMKVFVEAMPASLEDDPAYDMEPYEDLSMFFIRTASLLNQQEVTGPLMFKNKKEKWTVRYNVKELFENNPRAKKLAFKRMRDRQASVYKSIDGQSNPMLDILYKMSEANLQEEAEKDSCK